MAQAARTRTMDNRGLAALLLGLVLAAACASFAMADPKTGVVTPPAHVDPGMRVAPKPHPALPTPVVKPPAGVVPK